MYNEKDLGEIKARLIQQNLKGPWLEEPNRFEFEHAGMSCLMVRNMSYVWCGYVAVPPGHPAYEKHYDEVDVEVHGGLTYSDHCQKDGPICHLPNPGDPDNVWWLGFDTCHWNDYSPGLDSALRMTGNNCERGVYRDMKYVKAECEGLAEQLSSMR